jgi:pantoate--beta-alanine ligase
MQRLAREFGRRGRVGFVPTMGALHNGHLELVRAARRRSDSVVVSVFVNPIQFGPSEDFRRYPRNFQRDRRLLAQVGTDVIFRPSVTDMYPPGFLTHVDVGRLASQLCGRSRPGHFEGVTTVVAKLLNVVRPDVAVFGQKDAQQALVIQRMVRDLDYATRIVIVPTVREPDGLAMSSRNAYLTPAQRAEAPVLHRSLVRAREIVRGGERSAARIKAAMRRMIARESGGRVDYVEVVDTSDLAPVRAIRGEVLVALAVFFGRTRLIDNLIVRV